MTQEQKDLLLKDLCGRLPYRVKVQIKNEIVVLDSICDDDGYHFNFIGEDMEGVNIENIKPYLFPISSMTEEQRKKLFYLSGIDIIYGKFYTNNEFTLEETLSGINWLLKNHFDIYGLILMGLAIDATGKNIY